MSKLYDILTSTGDKLERCKKRHNISKKCYVASCVLNTLALFVPFVLAFQSNVMLTGIVGDNSFPICFSQRCLEHT